MVTATLLLALALSATPEVYRLLPTDPLYKSMVAAALPRTRQRTGKNIHIVVDRFVTDKKDRMLMMGTMKDERGRPAKDRTTGEPYVTVGYHRVNGAWRVHFIRFDVNSTADLVGRLGYEHLRPVGC